jgi:cellulose synthase (UDP-forming)
VPERNSTEPWNSVAQGALTFARLRRLLDLQATWDAGWLRPGDLAVAEGFISPEQLAEGLFPAGGRVVREPQPA